jgi:hypothetical protein
MRLYRIPRRDFLLLCEQYVPLITTVSRLRFTTKCKCWDSSQAPRCYYMLLLQRFLCSHKNYPLAIRPVNYLTLQIISTFTNQKIKIPPSLSQAFNTYHRNVFTLILSLPEGRVSIAWIPSNKMLFVSCVLSFLFLISFHIERRGQVVNTYSYSSGVGFRYRPGDRLSWLGFPCFSLVPPGKCWDRILELGHDRFLPRHF